MCTSLVRDPQAAISRRHSLFYLPLAGLRSRTVSKSDSNRGSGVLISSGAPLVNKRENSGHSFRRLHALRTLAKNGFSPADADFLIRDPDFLHQQSGVGLPKIRISFMRLDARSSTTAVRFM